MSTRAAVYRPTTVFVDESGIAGQSPLLVIGALKMGFDQGLVVNQLSNLRSKSYWRTEAHFSSITRGRADLYREAVAIVAASDCRFRCLILDTRNGDALTKGRHAWKVPAQLTIRLLRTAIWKHEIATAIIDFISVPANVNYESYITTAVNRQLDRQALVSTIRMNSKTCWGLEMADVLTGAVAHQYRQHVNTKTKSTSPKGQVARSVADAFNLDSLVGADTQKLKSFGVEHHIVAGRSEFSRVEVVAR